MFPHSSHQFPRLLIKSNETNRIIMVKCHFNAKYSLIVWLLDPYTKCAIYAIMCICIMCFEWFSDENCRIYIKFAGTIFGAEKLEKFLTYTQSDLYGNLMWWFPIPFAINRTDLYDVWLRLINGAVPNCLYCLQYLFIFKKGSTSFSMVATCCLQCA